MQLTRRREFLRTTPTAREKTRFSFYTIIGSTLLYAALFTTDPFDVKNTRGNFRFLNEARASVLEVTRAEEEKNTALYLSLVTGLLPLIPLADGLRNVFGDLFVRRREEYIGEQS